MTDALALCSALVLDTDPTLAKISGLVHGFTDREGGVSTGCYSTLNMAGKWSDDTDAVAENRRRVAARAGFGIDRLRTAKQVHGTAVVRATGLLRDATADALWCRREDAVVVGVLTADCVPILLADRDGNVAAAIHSGWRGSAANIAGAVVATLVREGIPVARLVATIGPCIELEAFEVGPEVAAAFDPAFVRDQSPRPHVDLVACVRHQLAAAGIDPRAIAKVGACTHADPTRYYSFRRDGAGIGQMLAFVGFT